MVLNFHCSVAVIDANNVVTTVPLRDPTEPHFFETATDMGESDLFENDESMSLNEPELDDGTFLDCVEDMQPDSYFTSQTEMSCFNQSMSLADDVPFDLDDNMPDLKDVSMSQLLQQSSDESPPGGAPSETSSQSEPTKEQPKQPGDGEIVKGMAVGVATALGLPFAFKFLRKLFSRNDDTDLPVANMAEQGGNSSSNSLTMSRSEMMTSSAAQHSSRNGALYLDMQ
jgi:hypothetical protein